MWGPDADGSLMLSNNAQAIPMLRVRACHAFPVARTARLAGDDPQPAFIGRVGGYYYLRGPYPQFPLVGNGYQEVNPQPYIWGDKLALKMSPNFELGVTITVMWAGAGQASYAVDMAAYLVLAR